MESGINDFEQFIFLATCATYVRKGFLPHLVANSIAAPIILSIIPIMSEAN